MSEEKITSACIRSFIVQTFPAARKQLIDDDAPLLESGIIDSLGMLDVVTFLEQTFNIKVEDEELSPENFFSIRCLAAYVDGKKPNPVADPMTAVFIPS